MADEKAARSANRQSRVILKKRRLLKAADIISDKSGGLAAASEFHRRQQMPSIPNRYCKQPQANIYVDDKLALRDNPPASQESEISRDIAE